jgi:hypothetical protein
MAELYLVRKNCEYSTEVIADSAEEAISQAQEVPVEYWDTQAWSKPTAEEADVE